MKLTFVGTAHDSVLLSRGIRGGGGWVVQEGDTQIHVDPGPGAITQLSRVGVNARGSTALVATSAVLHAAHDIVPLVEAMTFNGLDTTGVVLGVKAVVDNVGNRIRSLVERVIVIQPEQRYGINDVELKTLRTSTLENVGLRIVFPQSTIVYAGFTGYSDELVNQYVNAQVLILNVAKLEKDSEPSLSVADATKIITKIKPRLAVITGFGHEIAKADPIYQVRLMQQSSGVQVVAAKDGLVINPETYSADLGQKTLRTFKQQG